MCLEFQKFHSCHALMNLLMIISSHWMKYIWYSSQKSKYIYIYIYTYIQRERDRERERERERESNIFHDVLFIYFFFLIPNTPFLTQTKTERINVFRRPYLVICPWKYCNNVNLCHILKTAKFEKYLVVKVR